VYDLPYNLYVRRARRVDVGSNQHCFSGKFLFDLLLLEGESRKKLSRKTVLIASKVITLHAIFYMPYSRSPKNRVKK